MSTTVEISYAGGKKVNALIQDHLIPTDQSPEDGGEGTAPDPSQLMLAALATCSAITAKAYCEVKGIPTEGLGFRMVCDYDQDAGRYTNIKMVLNLPPLFPEEMKPKLDRILDRCFVKRHFIMPPEFEVDFQEK